MWARTSASLIARSPAHIVQRSGAGDGARAKSAEPSTGLMTAIAAIGVTAALAVLQLAPANTPAPSDRMAVGPTPLAVSPQQFAFLGLGESDVAVYRTEVSQVCPTTGPLDCVETEKYVRTPVGLPSDMRAGNISLSPNGSHSRSSATTWRGSDRRGPDAARAGIDDGKNGSGNEGDPQP